MYAICRQLKLTADDGKRYATDCLNEEGNGRAMRVWLDMLLKDRIEKCVDWQLIDKRDYLEAMKKSPVDSGDIKRLIIEALTDQIEDREIFIKGILQWFLMSQSLFSRLLFVRVPS